MKQPVSLIIIILILSTPTISIARVYGTNESSWQNGYFQGSLTGPIFEKGANWNPEFSNNTCEIHLSSIKERTLSNGIIMPKVTNTTACQNGFFDGWKNWCVNHAVNCIGNMTLGDFGVVA